MAIGSTSFRPAFSNAYANQQDKTTEDIVQSWFESHIHYGFPEDYRKARNEILRFLSSPSKSSINLKNLRIQFLPDIFNISDVKDKLRTLSLENTMINSLPDNFNPPNLEQLDLSYSWISILPSDFNPPKLKKLNLSSSLITRLPVNFNPQNLRELDLSYTPLTHLPDNFNPPDLDSLNLIYSEITHLPDGLNTQNLLPLDLEGTPMSHFPESYTLLKDIVQSWCHLHQHCSYPEGYRKARNEILKFLSLPSKSSINLSNSRIEILPDIFNNSFVEDKLRSLSLKNTDIISFDMRFNPPNLEELDLSNSRFTYLFSEFSAQKLEKLNLSNSQIKNLPFDFNPPELTDLNLSNSKIKRLPLNFNPQKLRELDLSDTPLICLPDNFNPPDLDFLLLNGSQITHLPDGINTQSLLSLDLEGTPMTHLPKSFNMLKDIVQSWCHSHQDDSNAIYYVEARDLILNFLGSSSAKDLDLSNLKISSLPDIFDNSEVKARLRTLVLNRTGITQLPINFNPTELRELDLRNTPIIHLPDGFNPPKLGSLFLENSGITHLPDDFNPPEFWTLDLSHTQITHLPVNFNPRNLRTLDLSHSQITHLPVNFNPPHLRNLNLSHSQITHLPVNFNPPALYTLDLSNAAITSLSEGIFSLPQTCTIHLTLSNFSNHVQDNFREITRNPNYSGPRVIYSMLAFQRNAFTHLSLEEAFENVLKKAKENAPEMRSLLQILIEDKTEEQINNLKIWLARLSETASAKSENNIRFFKDVISILKHAAESKEMNSIFYSVLETASTTCGDRIALSVLHFDIQKQLAQLDTSRPRKVYDFLVNCVFVMDFLEKRAMNIVPTLPLTDPLEVFLGLPIVLKGEFSIPINLGEMLFFTCSGLTQKHLDQTKADLKDDLQSEDKIFDFLIEQPKWKEMLSTLYKDEYQKIKKAKDAATDHPETYTETLSKINSDLIALSKKAVNAPLLSKN